MRTIQSPRNTPARACRVIHLQPNKPVSLAGRPGLTLACLHGELWITQEGHAADYIVTPGYRYRAQGFGQIVVNALTSPGALMVHDAGQSRCATSNIAPVAMASGHIERLAHHARWLRRREAARIVGCLLRRLLQRKARTSHAPSPKGTTHAQTCI